MSCDTSILLYGDSGTGKTAMIGEFAESEYVRTKGGVTRVYAADPGGYRTIQPYVNLGIVDIVDLRGRPYPWEWSDKIAKGMVPDAKGRWVLDQERNSKVVAWAFEGATAICDTLLQDAAAKAKQNIQVGGQAAPRFQERQGEGTNDAGYVVTGNSPAHYGQVQSQITMSIHESFYLPGTVIWTATARRAGDNDNPTAVVLGPQFGGGKLTSEAPRWFVLTFHAVVEPGNDTLKTKPKHKLMLEARTDVTTPGARGLGNSRLPLDAERPEKMVVEPASLVTALKSLGDLSAGAEKKIAARVAAAMKKG